jgi:hypothetical protein
MWTTESPGIEIAHAHSADEFIYILRRSNSCWWEGASMPWAFRGHSEPLTVDSAAASCATAADETHRTSSTIGKTRIGSTAFKPAPLRS